jgi:hypothetical protein
MRAGLATALVRTGVHAAETEAQLLARCEAAGVEPDYLMPRFAFVRETINQGDAQE